VRDGEREAEEAGGVAGRGAAEDGPRQAGASLRAEYEDGRRQWAARRRRAVFLSALWWAPGAVALGLLAGIGTHFALFGLLITVLALAAVIDVAFQRPASLDRIRDRANAESSTARTLGLLKVRGGGHTLNDRFFGAGGEPFEVEHLVVSPRGVFLVDSKQWHGFDVRLLGTQLYVNHVDQFSALKEMVAHAQALGEALTAAAGANEEVGVVTVTSVLAVHADNLSGTPRVMGGVIVVRPEQLLSVLRGPDLRWSPGAARHLMDAAEYLLPPR
jgi:hypothetical protein